MSSSSTTPTWTLENRASCASIHVRLPPGTRVHCETDAVVTFSDGIQVDGSIFTPGGGGFWASLSRYLFGGESFFTTVVQNTNTEMHATVMMAPADPGGIELHRINANTNTNTNTTTRTTASASASLGSRIRASDDDLLIIAGAYVASDESVRITTEIQSAIGNTLFSGTGLFLLRASGHGVVACAAYGSIHKFQLAPGEKRAVDNGHLVAWTANMPYTTRWANSSSASTTTKRIMASMKSGEGLMCFFVGPGTVYVQSHKPGEPEAPTKYAKSRVRHTTSTTTQVSLLSICLAISFVFVLAAGMLMILFLIKYDDTHFSMKYGSSFSSRYDDRSDTNAGRTTFRGYRAIEEM